MGSFSIWHWIIVILLVMLLFGRGKVSELMGDVAKGIKSFKKGMAEDDSVAEPPRVINRDPLQPVPPVTSDRVENNPKVG
jgi:sec-independent protein translocase protein TatA